MVRTKDSEGEFTTRYQDTQKRCRCDSDGALLRGCRETGWNWPRGRLAGWSVATKRRALQRESVVFQSLVGPGPLDIHRGRMNFN